MGSTWSVLTAPFARGRGPSRQQEGAEQQQGSVYLQVLDESKTANDSDWSDYEINFKLDEFFDEHGRYPEEGEEYDRVISKDYRPLRRPSMGNIP